MRLPLEVHENVFSHVLRARSHIRTQQSSADATMSPRCIKKVTSRLVPACPKIVLGTS